MAAELILTAEAEQDIADAGDWAERQRPGRGAKLLDRVAESIAAVRRSPRAFTPYHGDYRRPKPQPGGNTVSQAGLHRVPR